MTIVMFLQDILKGHPLIDILSDKYFPNSDDTDPAAVCHRYFFSNIYLVRTQKRYKYGL